MKMSFRAPLCAIGLGWQQVATSPTTPCQMKTPG